MYKSIHIQNFRCFEDTKIEGFEQINLIGGQNNAGKTALLEALYLGGEPSGDTLESILKNRSQENIIFENPDNQPFKYFFYNQDDNKEINISFSQDDVVKIESKYYDETSQGDDGLQVTKRAALTVDNQLIKFIFHTIKNGESNYKNSNQLFKILGVKKEKYSYVDFFSTNNSQRNIGKAFEKIVVEGKKAYLLKAFQTIEKDIVEVEFINNKLLLKRESENFLMPINLFGDAINKLCNWVLSIIGGETKIILIDEIENGIHHTNQQKFWTMLFDLAKEFDIQIFATSHSAEMIKAFQEVAKEHDIKGGYFDLTRHAKTGKILGIKTQLDTLGLKIEHQMNYRG